jgi:hypothetical protein
MKRSDPHRIPRTCTVLGRSTQRLGALAAIAILVATAGFAGESWANCAVRSGNPERTPDANLTDHGNGTITHTTTGLMWKKCPEGRTHSAGSCTGTTGNYNWQAALRRAVADNTAGNTDWRLPSRTELLSLVETGCTSPAINTTRFPNVAASAAFWTSTHAGTLAPDSAFAVRFNHGISFIATKDFLANARLVRGGTAHETYRATAPTEPAAFSFASKLSDPSPVSYDQDGNPVPRAVLSNIVNLTLSQSRNISITGGDYRIDGGAWTSAPPGAPGTITSGTRSLQLRVNAPYTTPGSASATVNVNGRTANFLVTTGTAPPDNIPDPFLFTDQTGVSAGAQVVSDPISITGTNQATDIAISGGEYEINGSGTWSSATGVGTLPAGATIRVRHTASASWGGGTANTLLTLGPAGSTVFDTFTSTTAARDIAPAPIAFSPNNPKTGVDLDSWVESDAITVSGINDAIDISVAGTAGRQSEYQIGTNGWTAVAGTVTNGQTVTVRHRSGTGYLNSANDTVQTTLTIGAGGAAQSATFTSKTVALDTEPASYSFTPVTGVTRSALNVTSNLAQITGINGPATIALVSPADASHQFQIVESSDGINPTSVVRDWGTASTTISNGQWVRVKHTAHASYSTSVSTSLTIGSPAVVRTFTSTTEAAPNDTTPDAFNFGSARTGVTRSLEQISSPVMYISGVSPATNITVSFKANSDATSAFRVNGGSWITYPNTGVVQLGQGIEVKHNASGSFNTSVATTLIIGGVEGGPFTTTTELQDIVPEPFNLGTKTDQGLNALIESDAFQITGINDAASVAIKSGSAAETAYQVSGDASWYTSGKTISNNQTIKVRHRSANSSQGTTTSTILIGGLEGGPFTVTTADILPSAFSGTKTGVTASSTVTFDTPVVTIAGMSSTIGSPVSVKAGSATGTTFSITGSYTYTDVTSGFVRNGDTLTVKHTAASGSNATAVSTIVIGGAGGTEGVFTSTTAACSNTAWSNVGSGTVFGSTTSDKGISCTTTAKLLTGICSSTSNLTFTRTTTSGTNRITYSIDGGTNWISTATNTVGPSNSIMMRFLKEDSVDTYTGTITINGVQKTWTHRTVNTQNLACIPP